ncbi:MAG: NADPH-dependent F420 reductase [Burkholderiaceae bacterium]|nr:NADPH-dependent F420 reductase [Burkholderiaceae bacterium]MEB2319133.1 NADPH-dependent F420 reductase [Pseudomonadota bacterium]
MESERRRFLELARLVPAGIVLAGLPLAARAATGDGGRLKIGIVGSGRVGGTLGTVWAKAGYQVMLSSRDIGHDRELAARIGPNARAGTPREAAAFGDVVTVSVPYRALPDVGRDLADLIRGKTVIDTCNPFVGRDGEIAKWAREKGAGLASAELLAGAHIVRAFNAIGYARMGAAHEEPGRIGMPIAGDDAQAIAIASRLIRDIGFEPVLVGGLAMGRHLMPGTPLAGELAPDEIRRIAATLD